jgi:hypothetical protein
MEDLVQVTSLGFLIIIMVVLLAKEIIMTLVGIPTRRFGKKLSRKTKDGAEEINWLGISLLLFICAFLLFAFRADIAFTFGMDEMWVFICSLMFLTVSIVLIRARVFTGGLK